MFINQTDVAATVTLLVFHPASDAMDIDSKEPAGAVVLDFASYYVRRERSIGEEELHAYVDAVLDAGRRAAIEAALAQDDCASARVASYRALNIDLHRLFDVELPPAPAPLAAMTREIERSLNTRPDWIGRLRAALRRHWHPQDRASGGRSCVLPTG